MPGFTNSRTWEKQESKPKQLIPGRKSNLHQSQPQNHQNQSNPTNTISESLTISLGSLPQMIESTPHQHQQITKMPKTTIPLNPPENHPNGYIW